MVSLFGVVAASYLGAYFFPAVLKAHSHGGVSVDAAALRLLLLGKPQVRSRLIGAGALALLIVGGMALIVALPKRRSLHGDARWATARHIRRAGLMSDQGIILGPLQESLSCVAGPNRCHLGGAAALGERGVVR